MKATKPVRLADLEVWGVVSWGLGQGQATSLLASTTRLKLPH